MEEQTGKSSNTHIVNGNSDSSNRQVIISLVVPPHGVILVLIFNGGEKLYYFVEYRIKCDETVIEKIRAIIERWKSIESSIEAILPPTDEPRLDVPTHWRIGGVFEESEKNNVYSLPLIIEDLGGSMRLANIIKDDIDPELYDVDSYFY